MREYRVRIEGLDDSEMKAEMTVHLGYGDGSGERFLRFVAANLDAKVRWVHLSRDKSSLQEDTWWPEARFEKGGVSVKVTGGPHFTDVKLARLYEERLKQYHLADLPPAPFAYEGSPYAAA